jgi:hypothetical protein
VALELALVRWIFDNDEHFLKSSGIQPWPEVDNYQQDIDEDRMTNLFSQGDYFENVPEHAYLSIDTSSTYPPLTDEVFESQVREELTTQIENFLTFSTKNELFHFISKILNNN